MAGIATFIAENLFSMADLTWTIETKAAGTEVLSHFAVEAVRVQVRFDPVGPEEYAVSFEVLQPSKDPHTAFYLFNGVFQSIEEFLEVRTPSKLIFASKREQLAEIYATYLRREAARLEALGYRQLETQRVPPFTEHVLVRVKAKRTIVC